MKLEFLWKGIKLNVAIIIRPLSLPSKWNHKNMAVLPSLQLWHFCKGGKQNKTSQGRTALSQEPCMPTGATARAPTCFSFCGCHTREVKHSVVRTAQRWVEPGMSSEWLSSWLYWFMLTQTNRKYPFVWFSVYDKDVWQGQIKMAWEQLARQLNRSNW
jgi:hypothetical protein